MARVSVLAAPLACGVMFGVAVARASDPVPAPPSVPHEQPPVLRAEDILRPDILAGPHHRVRSTVPTMRGHNRYVIDSDFGVFTADGNAMLLSRVAEIRAMARLAGVSKTDEYGEALANAAKAPVDLAKNLATDPVDTLSGIPQGVWKFMNRVGQSAKELGQGRQKNAYEDDALKSTIGFSKVKRELAAELHVDPYSSNEAFQEALNGVAWASYGGKMTFSAALAPLGGAAGVVAGGVQAGDASIKALYDLSPNDLRRRNLDALLGMGVAREDANAFLANPTLSPTHATMIVDALERLPGVEGRAGYVRFATDSESETDAIFLMRSAQVLAEVHKTTPLAAIRTFVGFPVAITADGTVVVGIEWDYACWTPQSEAFLRGLFAAVGARRTPTGCRIALSGDASPSLRQVCSSLGYRLDTHMLAGPLAPVATTSPSQSAPTFPSTPTQYLPASHQTTTP